MKVVQARIPEELADWVDSNFAHGFKQQFIEQCFVQLFHLVEGGHLPSPRDYAYQATKEAVMSTDVQRLNNSGGDEK